MKSDQLQIPEFQKEKVINNLLEFNISSFLIINYYKLFY